MASCCRRGLSLIELMMVLAIMAMLAAFSLPAVMRAVRAGAVNQAADRVVDLIHHAQQLARTTPPPGMAAGTPYYGVAFVGEADGRQYAVIIHGDDLADELVVGGRASMRVDLPPTVRLAVGDNGAAPATLVGRTGFFLRHGDGRPLAEASMQAAPIDIGIANPSARPAYNWTGVTFPPVPPAPRCSTIQLSPVGGRRTISIGVLALGSAFQSRG